MKSHSSLCGDVVAVLLLQCEIVYRVVCDSLLCVSRDRLSGHDYIATSYIDTGKTSRPGSDESEEDG